MRTDRVLCNGAVPNHRSLGLSLGLTLFLLGRVAIGSPVGSKAAGDAKPSLNFYSALTGGQPAAAALEVRLTVKPHAVAGGPVDLLLELVPAGGHTDYGDWGPKLSVWLAGSARFLPGEIEGKLIEGAGSNRAVAELRGGRARLLLTSNSIETDEIVIASDSIDGPEVWAQPVRVEFMKPDADPDGDGRTNLQELEEGTNPTLSDTDADGINDLADNCPTIANPSQADLLRPDDQGDACDDVDSDSVVDASDNCPFWGNPEQADADQDGTGDLCENPPLAPILTPPLQLPFVATDLVFDPTRPYLYASQKQTKKLYFVNLQTGTVEREFSFELMPESLAMTSDGSQLFVALLVQEHSSFWSPPHEGYIGTFDLASQQLVRTVHITEDPFDLAVTTDGHLVVPSGSGQFTYLRILDATTGQESGSVSNVRQMCRVALHPSEQSVYLANTDVSPSDIVRYDLLPGGGVARRWDSPYHGEHRMSGNVWASPLGDRLVTRGGDVYTVGATQSTDMLYVGGLTQFGSSINNLVFDAPRSVLFTSEGSNLRYYNLQSLLEIGFQSLPQTASFVGLSGESVLVATSGSSSTQVYTIPHPALAGATNTAPAAHFTVNPPTGQTTQMDLLFDASSSTDTEDPLSSLRFRWDLDADGTWDTTFGSAPTITKRYSTAGTRIVRLQVRDSLALVSEATMTINVTFEQDPGTPGPTHSAFELPFTVTDVVFDPVRPYMYVSRKSARKVEFVNLQTGFAEREFTFSFMPDGLAITPDGSRMFVALLTRDHSASWNGPYVSYIAGFDLQTQQMDRIFSIDIDPFDLIATSAGYLVASSGSGQVGTEVASFDAITGQRTNSHGFTQRSSRLALHPSEGIVYAANNGVTPSDIERFDVLASGGIVRRWDSPYSGQHRMNGNIWASPIGDRLITRGGDIFTVGATQSTDMYYVGPLTQPTVSINGLAYDVPRSVIFTGEAATLRFYNLQSMLEIGSLALSGTIDFLGIRGDSVYPVLVESTYTRIVPVDHPVLGGATNTPPTAHFTVSPSSGQTTQMDLVFDASSSFDAQDPLSSLRFRWDFDNDGSWDTSFDSSPSITKRYSTAGTRVIRLQVRDTLASSSEETHAIDVAFEPDPGTPGPANEAFELPFEVTDVVFDPVRPYMYVSRKSARKVDFVNLQNGFIEREFTFDYMPESLTITPDGSHMFVAMLTREHSQNWAEPREGYIAGFDLQTQQKDREFRIVEDPFDLVATTDGHIVVTSGSDQWTDLRVFDAATGQQTGIADEIRQKSRITLHPLEHSIYKVETDTTAENMERFDLLEGGEVVHMWDSPYGEDHRVDGNVWASPLGDRLITRGGDIFTVGVTQSTDMNYVGPLTQPTVTINDLAYDAPRFVVFTGEAATLRFYNLQSMLEIGSQALSGTIDFLGVQGNFVYPVLVENTYTRIVPIDHPALGGATNTPPTAHFTVSPPSGQTTQMDLVFDASSSFDAQDSLSSLQFRCDFESDGTWDTAFQGAPTIVKRFNTAGTKHVRLQVRDSLALVSEASLIIDVAFEPDPGTPGPAHVAFELPFEVTDAVFDPIRPYVYVSRKSARKVDVVNLQTGFIEREFAFAYMPESLTVTPDGSRMFVALLTQEHDPEWWDPHDGYIAGFDLQTRQKDREFRIIEDPFDLVATTDGHLVVPSGSGQSDLLRVFDAVTGQQTGFSHGLRQMCRVTLHPSEHSIYTADTESSPSDIERFDLLEGGGVAGRWDSPYHGDHRMDGNVWASPLGDRLITRGGDIFSVGPTQSSDMLYQQGLTASTVEALSWNLPRLKFVTAEGTLVREYDLSSFQPTWSQALAGSATFVGTTGYLVYALRPVGLTTKIDVFDVRPDTDGDTIPDVIDNCPTAQNPDQSDPDGDHLGSACDNCPATSNSDQLDTDGDHRGDVCECDSVICDPSDQCHMGSCDSRSGACQDQARPDGAVCDDANACTVGDACVTGICTPQRTIDPKVDCDDRNKCSRDYCDPDLGCYHLPVACNDGNPRTVDSCVPQRGCVFTPRHGTFDPQTSAGSAEVDQ